MIPEDRLRRLLHEAAIDPEGPGNDRGVLLRLRRRRRTRRLIRGATGVGVVALVAVLVVAVASRPSSRHEVTSAPAPALPGSPRPSTQLVVFSATAGTFIDATSGHVVRTLPLDPALPGPAGGQVSVDGAGHTAYLSVLADVSCASNLLIAADLTTGRTRQLGSGAYPAVSSDGSQLAYVRPEVSTGPSDLLGAGCDASQIVVQNLKNGMVSSWQLPAGPGLPAAGPIVTSLAWGANGTSLIIGYQGNSGIEVLDVTQPVSATNPTPVPGTGYFRDPVEAATGQLVAYGPICMPGMGCPSDRLDIVTLDPRTGRILKTLYVDDGNSALSPVADLFVDPSGTRVATLVMPRGLHPSNGVAVLEDGALHVAATTTDTAAAWLPNQ